MPVTAINTTYRDKTMTAQDFAILVDCLASEPSGVITGCIVSKTSDSQINVSPGWAVVRGRLIRVEGGNISLPATTSNVEMFVVIKVDLANTSSDSTASLTAETNTGTDTTNFNLETDGIAYTTVATFTRTTSSITNIVNSTPMSRPSSCYRGVNAPTDSTVADGSVYYQINNSKLTIWMKSDGIWYSTSGGTSSGGTTSGGSTTGGGTSSGGTTSQYNYKVSTKGGTLTIRSSRNSSSSVVGYIPNGTKIYVTDISSGWGKVTYSGKTGYISTNFITGL